MRVTKPRVAIIEALLHHETPVAIEQLHQEINATSCDLVTVYRCLGAFEEIGLVRRSFHHNGTSLFELVRPGRSRSYHIQCKACGKVEPVDYFPVDGMERILTERGYTQLSHLVEFFGICPACQPAHTAPSRQIAVKPAKA